MKLDVISDSSHTSSVNFSESDFLPNSYKTNDIFCDLETQLKENRKSFYDNHRMILKDESCDSNNSSELETNMVSEYSSNYHECDVESTGGPKVERDDFDDLIDLTHRVPRKLLKKNSPTSIRKRAQKPSSLPPLPPLPYSFVKIERSKADSNICLKSDSRIDASRKSVTRLIMPVQNLNEKNSQKKFEPDKYKHSDVIQEWDQISKIFASLETLLNDVVETTTKVVEDKSPMRVESGNQIIFHRGKTSQSQRAISEHNLKKCDNSFNSINFNSINRSTNTKNKNLKKLPNDSLVKESTCPISRQINTEKNSFHLNMKKFKYFELSEYLSKLNLSKYEFKFLTNGYDDLAYLNNVLTLQDLIQIGIDDYNDIFTILNEIKKLPSKIRRIANENIQFNSVSEWLNYLNLNEYIENFTRNNVINMEMAKSLWEIELSTIIQIPLIGHRKRIINSIKQMFKNENSLVQSQRHDVTVQDETDIENIDEDHLFKPKQKKQTFYKPEEIIYSSTSTSSKSSSESSSSPPLSCSSRKGTCSTSSSKSNNKIEKVYSNSLLELNNRPRVIRKNHRGEAQKKRNASLENSIYSVLEAAKNVENKSPKTIWKNDPQDLIKGSFNFVVNYLGSSAITKMKTNEDPVKATIDRLKNTSKNTPYPLPKIELAVSINGVKLLNVNTKETLFNYDIKHINNVCQDQDDLDYFAFSTQSDPSAHYYCHVFSCKDKELSTQVILTIGQAFDVAFELFCKNNFN